MASNLLGDNGHGTTREVFGHDCSFRTWSTGSEDRIVFAGPERS